MKSNAYVSRARLMSVLHCIRMLHARMPNVPFNLYLQQTLCTILIETFSLRTFSYRREMKFHFVQYTITIFLYV